MSDSSTTSSVTASASALAATASETANKFAGFANRTFSRAVQYSQEKMGNVEKTEYDYRFQQLSEKADKTKSSTEKVVKSVELYLEPSTGVRLQNFVNSKLNRPRTSKETHLERVGSIMIESGELLGSDEQYGGALIRAGIVQQHIGEAWAELAAATTMKFLEPKSKFLNGDVKELNRLRTKLSRARLDLDVAKAKVRKAQTGPAEKLAEAESQLRSAQWEFDEQYKQVKAALETTTEEHDRQLGQLIDYIEIQYEYFQNATKLMGDLVTDLRALRPPSANATASTSFAPKSTSPVSGFGATAAAARTTTGSSIVGRKARVVYDHEANNDSELTVSADDIVTVLGEPTNVNGVNLCLCEVRGSKGLVPHAFLQWEN